MEESIVSPWFVYLLFNIDSFITVLVIPCVILGGAVLVYYIGGIVNAAAITGSHEAEKGQMQKSADNWRKVWKEHIRYLIPIFISALLLATLIPNKDTLIAIYIADQLTWKKVEKTVEITNDIKNSLKKDAIDIIEMVTKNKTEPKK